MRYRKPVKRKKPTPTTPFTFKALHERWIASNKQEAKYIETMLSLLGNEVEYFQQLREQTFKRNEEEKQLFLEDMQINNEEEKYLLLRNMGFELPEGIIDQVGFISDLMIELEWHNESTETMRNLTCFFDDFENIPDIGCKDWSHLEQYEPHSKVQAWLFYHLYQQMKGRYNGYPEEEALSQVSRKLLKQPNSRPRLDIKKKEDIDFKLVGRLIGLMQQVKILPQWSGIETSRILRDLSPISDYLRPHIGKQTTLSESQKIKLIDKLKLIIQSLEQ